MNSRNTRWGTTSFRYHFAKSLFHADDVILTDIYGAGEHNPDKIDSRAIYDQLAFARHPSVKLIPQEELSDHLFYEMKPQGIVAFLGAGDIGEVAHAYAHRHHSVAQG